MNAQNRKELLIHEANNPNSIYVCYEIKDRHYIEFVLSRPSYHWKVYQKPTPNIVDYCNDHGLSYNVWYVALDFANENKSSACIGQYKRTRCGKTGIVKSIELIKD